MFCEFRSKDLLKFHVTKGKKEIHRKACLFILTVRHWLKIFIGI